MSGIRTITVSEQDDGQRLDRWIRKVAPDLPFSLVQKLIRKGQVRIDGKRGKMDSRLSCGQEIRIPPSTGEAREDRYFQPRKGDDALVQSMILHDDGDLIVINKPYGIAAQGGYRIERHIDGLMEHLTDAEGGKPKLCHRLDRDTSGLLILARTRDLAMKVGKAFEGKTIRKYYWAVVSPSPQEEQGSIIAPLAKGEDDQKDLMIVDEEKGKFARSEFRVLARAGKRAALVALWPRTGRTHQLRVHCAVAGFPIIGDQKYGPDRVEGDLIETMGLAPRLHLHAGRIILPNPSGKGVLDLRAPLPGDLAASLSSLGFENDFLDDPFADIKI